MDIEVRPCASVEELRDALDAIGHYFGHENQRRGRRAVRAVDRGRAHARRVRTATASSAGPARSRIALSVPGGATVPAAGVTVVGVLPTHRRRGVLTRDDDARSSRTAARAASSSRTCGRRRRRSTAGSATASRRGSASLRLAQDRVALRARRSSRAARCGWSSSAEAREHVPAALRPGAARSGRACSRAARSGGRRAGSSTTPPAGRAGR